ncbi:unnamed protein product [Lactuca saligna]|uniref:Uncharacterized protein n=1 Tax=Lactuca saligna TaxID=75948 RepID=A0AA36EEN3_LACSI|nr:unnamed protein product [Lactuca saligna]
MARVLCCFHVVADDFPGYILNGAGMSTSWRLCEKRSAFYAILRGVEKRVDFMDMLAKKWVGSLRYREDDLIDRVLPFFPIFDPVSVNIGVESSRNKSVVEEVVEDSKEGVIPLVYTHKSSWKSVNDQNVEQKATSEENVVRFLPDFVLESSECFEVWGEQGSMKEGLCLVCFGHLESPVIGASEVEDAEEFVGGGGRLEDVSRNDVDHLAAVDEALDAFAFCA